MAQVYEFEVSEKPLGDGRHSYQAEDMLTGDIVALPFGGNDDGTQNLVGSYPEIEGHLATRHSVTTKLAFYPSLDEMHYRPGGATWTYRRDHGQVVVIVRDIHRTVFRFTVEWARS